VLVRSLGHVAQVDIEPSLGGAFLVAPEGNLQVLLPTAAAQHHNDLALITSRRIEIAEQAGIRRDAKPALTQNAEATEHRNGIWVQMNQFAPNVVQDREKEFT
jgi:hypothetical protein